VSRIASGSSPPKSCVVIWLPWLNFVINNKYVALTTER
jgi:hypothetical protein